MKAVNVALGAVIFAICLVFAVSVPYGIVLFNNPLPDDAVNILRVVIMFIGCIAGIYGFVSNE